MTQAAVSAARAHHRKSSLTSASSQSAPASKRRSSKKTKAKTGAAKKAGLDVEKGCLLAAPPAPLLRSYMMTVNIDPNSTSSVVLRQLGDALPRDNITQALALVQAALRQLRPQKTVSKGGKSKSKPLTWELPSIVKRPLPAIIDESVCGSLPITSAHLKTVELSGLQYDNLTGASRYQPAKHFFRFDLTFLKQDAALSKGGSSKETDRWKTDGVSLVGRLSKNAFKAESGVLFKGPGLR
jgi:hypothetical protein